MAVLNPYLYRQPTNTYSGNAVVSQNQLLRQLASYGPDGGTVPTTTQPGTTAPSPTAALTPINRTTSGDPNDPWAGVVQAGQTNPDGTPRMAPTMSTAAPPGTTSGGGGGGGSGLSYDFSGDPILARIRAMNAQNIAQAEAAALAQRKRAEIGYGYDPNLQYEDPATAEAAKVNPFSTLFQLLSGHTDRAHALDENLNKANLFYSSTRANEVGREGQQYLGERSQAGGVLQNLMDQIAQGVLQTKLSAQQQEIQAENDAYNRALQFALANGGGIPGAGGGGGGGGNLQYTSGAQDALRNAGYSDEQIAAAIAASGRFTGPAAGVGGYGVQQNGQVFTDSNGKYIMVKGGTPGGNSTEKVYLP